MPNDFSILQKYLYKNKNIDNAFWVTSPDHISYFSTESLQKLVTDIGYEVLDQTTSFPVDILLLNDDSNYIMDKSKGKAAHMLRVKVENFLHELSPIETNRLYSQLAKMGVGRDYTIFIKQT